MSLGRMLTDEEVKDYIKQLKEKYPDMFKPCKIDVKNVDLTLYENPGDVDPKYIPDLSSEVRVAPELMAITKVYKDDKMNLKENYELMVATIPYKELYKNIVEVFPYLKEGADDGDWNSGTAGWHTALVKTLGKEKVDLMYHDLEWYDCDHLDGAIENRLDMWYKTREKRRKRFKDVDKAIEEALIEKDLIFGDTAAEIHKSIIEVTPKMIKAEVRVRPMCSVEEIKISIIVE